METMPQINLLTASNEEFDQFMLWLENQSEPVQIQLYLSTEKQGDVLMRVPTEYEEVPVE